MRLSRKISREAQLRQPQDRASCRRAACVPKPRACSKLWRSGAARAQRMTSAGEAALGALELRECARGRLNFNAAAPPPQCGLHTAAAVDFTYECGEARNGSRSTSCTAALAAVGSEAAQSKRAVELPPGSRHAHCGRAASRRLQGLAVRVDPRHTRARIIARGRLATIVDEQGQWRGFYGPPEVAARTHGSELRVRTKGGVNMWPRRCE